MRRKALKAAFPCTIPIFTEFWFFGLAYGIYMKVSGFSFVYPILMSLLIFGGSLEFITVKMHLSPFAIFNEKRKTPAFVQYLGRFLPSAVFGMLVVYCLCNVHVLSGTHGLPEFISILVTGVLHIWKRQMLLSIAGGTICYMLLLHFIFYS